MFFYIIAKSIYLDAFDFNANYSNIFVSILIISFILGIFFIAFKQVLKEWIDRIDR